MARVIETRNAMEKLEATSIPWMQYYKSLVRMSKQIKSSPALCEAVTESTKSPSTKECDRQKIVRARMMTQEVSCALKSMHPFSITASTISGRCPITQPSSQQVLKVMKEELHLGYRPTRLVHCRNKHLLDEKKSYVALMFIDMFLQT